MATHPFAESDARFVTVAKTIHVLRPIAWPGELCERFLVAEGRAAPPGAIRGES